MNFNNFLGHYIGYSIGDMSLPQFFDAHANLAKGEAAGIGRFGKTASGKSHAAMADATRSALMGKNVIFIEPNKIDTVGIHYIPEIRNCPQIEKNIFFLPESEPGILDPFRIYTDKSKAKTCAIDAIQDVFGTRLYEKHRLTISSTIKEFLEITENPTLNQYITYLRSIAKRDSKESDLEAELTIAADSKFSELIFGHPNQTDTPPQQFLQNIDNPGINIISMSGINLPKEGTPERDYRQSERIGIAILSLILTKIESIIFDPRKKKRLKEIFIDEAWLLLSTSQAKTKIEGFLRLCRTYNTAVHLLSQNPTDLEPLSEHIATWFGNKISAKPTEIESAARLLGITPQDALSYMPNFTVGQTIFRNTSHEPVAMQFDPPTRWFRYFETNPVKQEAEKFLT